MTLASDRFGQFVAKQQAFASRDGDRRYALFVPGTAQHESNYERRAFASTLTDGDGRLPLEPLRDATAVSELALRGPFHQSTPLRREGLVCTERVDRPEAGDRESYEYFVALGIFRDSLEYRHRYRRRPVGMRYYAGMGRGGYRNAAANRLAGVYKLEDVFLRLALQSDHYRERLSVLVREYLFH